MTQNLAPNGATHAVPGKGRFATLTFERDVAAPVVVLWEAWTAPTARAVWAAPSPSVTVEFLEADSRVGGREISLCKVEGQPDIRCECGWLALQPTWRSINYEVISSEGVTQSVALVTADISGTQERSRLAVTVQLSSLAEDMEAGYQEGFGARLMAEGKAAGRPRSALDMIAAIASANDCAVVTDNEKDFAGLQIINPLRECSRRMTQRAFPASGLKASQPGNLDDATIGSPRLVAAEATQKRGAPWKSKKSRVSVSYSLRRPSISIRRIATISLLRLRKRDSVLEIADDNLRILIVSSMRSNHGQPSLHPASAHLHQV
ncbi:hypothetical protein [Phyllobacterium phragmitis]|uniref:ATPase n=1 Tax=Phyllobacterium phragmitis TaxID=2670329 RepID=A0ABQ0H5H8_9HYPH